jgi:hypothetical protein
VNYATVIPKQSSSGVRLQVAARSGDVIRYTALNAGAPKYEEARAEAQRLYPDRLIVVPMLKEQVPT